MVKVDNVSMTVRGNNGVVGSLGQSAKLRLAVLQVPLSAVALGYIPKRDDHTRQLVAFDHGDTGVIHREECVIVAPENLVAPATRNPVSERRQNRLSLHRKSGAIRGGVPKDLTQLLADAGVGTQPEHFFRCRVNEANLPLRV